MNLKTITAIVWVLIAIHQSASAYSSIFTINDWSTERLKEAGITITPWKHEQVGDQPSKNWIKVTFDTSKVGDHNVLMTLTVDAFNKDADNSFRVERKKGEPAEISLTFAVDEKKAEDSRIEIIVPQQMAQGDKRAPGNPGFGGYSLSLTTVLKLAAESAEDTASIKTIIRDIRSYSKTSDPLARAGFHSCYALVFETAGNLTELQISSDNDKIQAFHKDADLYSYLTPEADKKLHTILEKYSTP